MRRSGKVFIILGCLMIAVSIGLILFLQVQSKRANQNNDSLIQTMESILADRREGALDYERDSRMPVLELQNEDFVAMLEIPMYGCRLPVCSAWDRNKVISYPCRFFGSAYDGTLVIGGYDQAGQFDFFDRIQDGTEIQLTDMTGCTFTYEVARVERSGSADADVLMGEGSHLTLFVRDAQLLEYIILRCVVK